MAGPQAGVGGEAAGQFDLTDGACHAESGMRQFAESDETGEPGLGLPGGQPGGVHGPLRAESVARAIRALGEHGGVRRRASRGPLERMARVSAGLPSGLGFPVVFLIVLCLILSTSLHRHLSHAAAGSAREGDARRQGENGRGRKEHPGAS